jgi:hypothetical protein
MNSIRLREMQKTLFADMRKTKNNFQKTQQYLSANDQRRRKTLSGMGSGTGMLVQMLNQRLYLGENSSSGNGLRRSRKLCRGRLHLPVLGILWLRCRAWSITQLSRHRVLSMHRSKCWYMGASLSRGRGWDRGYARNRGRGCWQTCRHMRMWTTRGLSLGKWAHGFSIAKRLWVSKQGYPWHICGETGPIFIRRLNCYTRICPGD